MIPISLLEEVKALLCVRQVPFDKVKLSRLRMFESYTVEMLTIVALRELIAGYSSSRSSERSNIKCLSKSLFDSVFLLQLSETGVASMQSHIAAIHGDSLVSDPVFHRQI